MQVFLRLVGLLALPCLKAFFKFLLQMYELGSWAGQDNKDDEVRVSRTSVTLLSILNFSKPKIVVVTSISLRREGADIHVDVGLCITQVTNKLKCKNSSVRSLSAHSLLEGILTM
ncbi:uncharacterized protein Pyn_19429 [Prunus yedoensis var. nudiflora]|uniref:Uncharacterized protein n=1 Tax=Prunus yedoensis var. nudiflora TaxID=2094558 RepID=A0A314XWX2_PRUYE|nr:uncharacterized protein Pyn_19429 [Prunus yedoensis var. nudiflora]